jgi:hypothetical protein
LLLAADDLGSFAAIVLGIQAVTAAALLAVALRGRAR